MDDEFEVSGADTTFDEGGDSSVGTSFDSPDSSCDLGDSGSEDMAEAIPEDPPPDCGADDCGGVDSGDDSDAIEELPSGDDSGEDDSDVSADPPPDDGVGSGEDGGAADLNEDELEDEVPCEDSNEDEMTSGETLPEDSADSNGESEEESSGSLSIDEVEQQSEGEGHVAAAEDEQPAEADVPLQDSQELTLDDVEVTVPEGMDPIDLKGPDFSECSEEIGHQDLADIELNRELEVGERVKDRMDSDACAENVLDAAGNQVEDAGRPSIDTLNEESDRAVEMVVADGHKADYTENYDQLMEHQEQCAESDDSQEAASATHDLRDVLREASDAGGDSSGSSDVSSPKGSGMDDDCVADQRHAVAFANQMKMQRDL